MSKVSKVIEKIRDTLNDPNGDRWDDARLMRAINDAMMAINLRAKILRYKSTFDISANTHTYQLSDTIQTITRCTYKGIPVKFQSHEQMDNKSTTWETDTASDDEITYIIYDKLNKAQVRLYPIPSSSIDGVTPAYGVVTEIDGFTFNSVYGVVTSLEELLETIVMYYIKKPTEVTTIDDELPFDSSWDNAIKYYVCGHTLRDDKDTQNRAMGNEELQLYTDELKEAKDSSAEDSTTANQYETNYRRGI